ncbi:MAG: hypothetical protein P8J37_05630 [Fuerstiella sp.]|nr:hypothetical protein [Fuerstiella sp.]
MKHTQILIIAAACCVSIGLRFLDTPLLNFSSVVALALLCGSVVRHPVAFLLPLGVRVLTDVLLHLKTGHGFFPSWPLDYSAYVLIFLVGRQVAPKRYTAVIGGSIASIAIYFLLSNFGVWLIWPDTYSRSAAGLVECFVKAIPFARGTILGNLIAAPVFFAMWNAFAVTDDGGLLAKKSKPVLASADDQ